jgi:ribose 5-phosphate isomerase A
VPVLAGFPLPLEVIPMARSYIGREVVRARRLARAAREFHHRQRQRDHRLPRLTILNPPELERDLNNLAGLVTNGLFAQRPADVLLLAEPGGVRTLSARKA